MNAAAKKSPRIFWKPEEWEEWRIAVELEAAPRPDGGYGVIALEAMKHMTRKRPVVPELIKGAGEIIRAYRKEQLKPKPALHSVQKPTTVVEAVGTTTPPPAVPEPEPVVLPPTHWTEQLADDLSRVLIETIVRTTESPAVRKAVRSLIQVATSRDFKPEIDNTIPWAAPVVGPRLPRVLVVGFWRIGPVNKLIEQFGNLLDLRFWRTDDSLNQLRGDLQKAEQVVFVAGTSNHTVRQTIVSSGKPFITLPLSGGVSMAARELQKIVDAWKDGRE
jgi:hypothetical protein